MTNDNDLFLLASSQNNKIFEVYIDSSGKKTLIPQTRSYSAKYHEPYICNHRLSVGLLYDKTSRKEVIFPNCSGASGEVDYGAFDNAFYKCTSLTSVSFPSLTTATGGSGSGGSRVIYGAFRYAFVGCTSLTSVSFPSLTSVISGSFYEAFDSCSPSLKVHFKKSMKGKTGLDYKTMGLKSADQVVFDLP